MPEPVFPESPAFFRGTFHARARFPGRFCNFPGDLPCQEPFSRKVLRFSGDLPCWRLFSRKVLPFSGGPSMPGAIFLEGPAFFRGTFHARGHFPGRSCVFPGDLPCQGPFSWKVLRFSGGPSMPGAIFLEGPALFRGTFHARGHFPGRSCVFPGDLPCQGPFSRKVLRFSGGPSMPGAIFPEGPVFFRGTFHARGHFPGRFWCFQWDLPCQSPFSWKVLPFSGGPSMPGAIFLEGPAFFRGTFHARGHFPGRSCVFPGDLPCQGPFSWKVLRFSGGPSMPGAIFPEGPAFFRGTFHARGHFPGRSLSKCS